MLEATSAHPPGSAGRRCLGRRGRLSAQGRLPGRTPSTTRTVLIIVSDDVGGPGCVVAGFSRRERSGEVCVRCACPPDSKRVSRDRTLTLSLSVPPPSLSQ